MAPATVGMPMMGADTGPSRNPSWNRRCWTMIRKAKVANRRPPCRRARMMAAPETQRNRRRQHQGSGHGDEEGILIFL